MEEHEELHKSVSEIHHRLHLLDRKIDSLRNSSSKSTKTTLDRLEVQTLGMRFCIYFVFLVPLLMILFSYADHLVNEFVFKQATPWEMNSEIIWVCTAAMITIVSFGWKNEKDEGPSFSQLLKIARIFKQK